MKSASATLAIIQALLSLPVLLLPPWLSGSLISGAVDLLLIAAGIAALRGSAVIYLAAAWGLYLGMNLAANFDVFESALRQFSRDASFGLVIVTIPLLVSLSGLWLCLRAGQSEAQK